MNNQLKVYSVPKDLSLAFNSWEILDTFDNVTEITNSLFEYTVDGYEITLKERGTYRIVAIINITSSDETSVGIQLRLQLNGDDLPIVAKGYTENTIALYEEITIDDESVAVIYAYITTDDTPTLSIDESNYLLIERIR